MPSVTLTQLVEAIATTFEGVAALIVQEAEEATEGIQDPPILQIYPETWNADAGGGNTDRTTFGGGRRQTDITILADLYAKERSHIGEDFAVLLPLVDAMIDILEAQDAQPYFGLADVRGNPGIASFRWSGERVTIVYAQQRFVGARFTITCRIF